MIKVNGYIIDLATSEKVSYESEATRYPVESGGEVTDAVVNYAPVLSVEFVVSDSPIGEVAKARQGSASPSTEARGYLLALRDSREPFTVECSRGTFPNMVFETIEETSDASTGAAMVASFTARRIDIREIRRTVVADRGYQVSRTLAAKTLWYCPTMFTTNEYGGVIGSNQPRVTKDDAFNEVQGCYRIERRKDGDLYYAATAFNGHRRVEAGQKLTADEVRDYKRQKHSDHESVVTYDMERKEYVTRHSGANGGPIVSVGQPTSGLPAPEVPQPPVLFRRQPTSSRFETRDFDSPQFDPGRPEDFF